MEKDMGINMTYKNTAKRREALKIKKTYYAEECGHISLSNFNVGEGAVICGFASDGGNISDRLRDMGFTEGCYVECVGQSPLGGMSAFYIRGAVIALRDEDAASVICEV